MAEVCLTVKWGSTGFLTQGSSGTLAQGADTEDPRLGGRRGHPSDHSSEPLPPLSSSPGKNKKSAVIASSPAFSASCGSWNKHLLLPTVGENDSLDSDRLYSTEGRAGS